MYGMDKKKRLPRIKKTVSAFISNEEGRISKKSIVLMSSLVGGIAIAKLLSEIIPNVEACSHSQFYSHNFTNTMTGGYAPSSCAIKAEHTLHTQAVHTNSW